ncbi:MAG TPA: class I SAM-dependent methyltransferase [Ktedonobacterales bacterium]
MELQHRAACFACGGHAHAIRWKSPQKSVIACAACGAEWIVGQVDSEQAYSYTGRDDLTERYLVGRGRRFAAYLRRVLPGGQGRLLDVGCGTGAFLAEAARLGWDVAGVELTAEAAALARELSGFEVRSGDICEGQVFPPHAFEVVTLWGVLEHVPDPQALLLASMELLRPGGVVLFETPNPRGFFRRFSRLLMRATGGRFAGPFQQTLGAGHLVWYSPRAVRAAASQLHSEVVDLRGTRNSTRFLLTRWAAMPLGKRLFFQGATVGANLIAAPLGLPNQIAGALRVGEPGQ